MHSVRMFVHTYLLCIHLHVHVHMVVMVIFSLCLMLCRVCPHREDPPEEAQSHALCEIKHSL